MGRGIRCDHGLAHGYEEGLDSTRADAVCIGEYFEGLGEYHVGMLVGSCEE